MAWKFCSLSKALEEIYCKEGAENQVLRQNNVTFVIFTSWSDDSGINAALSQQTPWLHCSLAKSQSIFMVAINGGSLNLAKLALPSKELFIDMGDFKEVPMSSLVNKIILTTCECATQQDGTLPAGCPLSESVIHYQPMKLQCDVLVQRRGSTFRNRRPSKSILTLAKTNSGDAKKFELVVSTPTNRSGLTFPLSSTTLSSVHMRFANEGRATVQLAEPSVDVFVSKATPDRLKKFLTLISCVMKGEDVDLDEKKRVRSTDFASQSKQMVIMKYSDYPVHPLGFPANLTELSIVGVGLCRVDGRWFGLKSLQVLDLRNNLLGEAPDFRTKFLNVARLRGLQLLMLGKNKISNFTAEQWLSLPSSLLVLDISNNLFTGSLPRSISRLRRLATLTANGNQLNGLPHEICMMSSLRELRLSGNDLHFIPASVRCLRLEYIDLSGNEKLFAPFAPYRHLSTTVATLVQIAAASVQNGRLPTEGLPWDLRSSLSEETLICSICRRLSPKDSTAVQCRQLDLSMIVHTVSRAADREGSQVLAHYYYCRSCSKFSFQCVF
ncbi:Leucine-rich repeat protein 1 [Toxocara canis]|uniref:Leucine-rich repeat protein 1 n=1 Tax=Toxocara canis TaxID=6265 RepID=A0A0B2W2P5_TOXCA|nr:Leucine-rich repeat protein 1 [Toxocara canis]